MRTALLLACVLLAVAAQTTPPLPSYGVVVIRPSKSGLTGTDIDSDDTTFQAKNISLPRLLTQAYGVRPELISGLPGWASSARYDVNAKVLDPDLKLLENLTRDQRRTMIAAFLADRFQLKVHFEPKTLPVYELVLTRDGPKFRQSQPQTPGGQEFGPSNMSVRNQDLTASVVSMGELADRLSQQTDRPIVDRTGLTARYDLHLTWSSERAAEAALASGQADAPPVLFTALQEQLGLKLIPGKGAVPTLVVDHIQSPSEN